MKILSETDKAYIAGLVDGEGCIRIERCKKKESIHPYNFRLLVAVTNTNLNVLLWLKEITGVGNIHNHTRSDEKANPKWKQGYVYHISSIRARDLLTAILPFLKIKKEIAEIGLQFPADVSHKQGVRGRSVEEYNAQNRIFGLIHEKNRREVLLPVVD